MSNHPKPPRWEAESTGLSPVLSSSILHYRFEAIHPFADGNGRCGRAVRAAKAVTGAFGAQERPLARKRAQEVDVHSANQAHTGYIRRAYACTNGRVAQTERAWRCERNLLFVSRVTSATAEKIEIRDLGTTSAPTSAAGSANSALQKNNGGLASADHKICAAAIIHSMFIHFAFEMTRRARLSP